MKRVVLFSVIFSLFVIKVAPAPEGIRIKQILARPYDLAKETVRLEGKVIKFSEVKAASSSAYIFQDDYGDEIKVITNNTALPKVGNRYLVTGMVFVDNADKDNPEVNILETGREIPQYGTQGDTSQPGGQNPKGKKNEKLVNVLFGIAAVLLVVIAVLAVLMISGKAKDNLTSAASAISGYSDSISSDYPEPHSYIEDSTIRVAAPPEGTLKFLPGKLEIKKPLDEVKEIPFYKHPSQEETEFTLGREPGTPYIHIQLKSQTVSAKQAKILWTNGKYMLINYSTTNPTKVNGDTLDKDQSVILKDNSTIEMGKIVLKFHEK